MSIVKITTIKANGAKVENMDLEEFLQSLETFLRGSFNKGLNLDTESNNFQTEMFIRATTKKASFMGKVNLCRLRFIHVEEWLNVRGGVQSRNEGW